MNVRDLGASRGQKPEPSGHRAFVVPFAALLLAACGATTSALPSSSAQPPVASPIPTSAPAATPITTPARPLTGAYLGQTPPGTTPTIFAPGVVSRPSFTEWSGTFSPDGTEYYFYRFTDATPSEILSSRVVDGAWTDPEPLGITAGFSGGTPHVSADNQRLYFMSDRPLPEGETSDIGGGGYWVAKRAAGGGWSSPTYAGQGMFLSSTRAGQMYTTDMSSWHADRSTYLAEVGADRAGAFTTYKRLAIDAYLGSQAHPCISPDGRYLLFDVSGGEHLLVSFRQADGTWGKAIDLTTKGFDQLAGGATLSPDGKYLFFHLRGDIWWVDARVVEELAPPA